jgi:two-component system OmpR family sensor kinase
VPHIRGIKYRWIVNNLIYVVSVIFICVIIFTIGIMNYYYINLRTNLINRAIINSRYFNENISTSFDSFYTNARRQTLDFADKEMLERQILHSNGRIMFSSSGLPAGVIPATPDIELSINENAIKTFSGKDPITGERIMSVSCPLVSGSSGVIGVLRYVTSLREVDRRIIMSSAGAVLVAVIIIVFVFISNRYFIRSIVNPLREITEITKKITKGSYGVKIEKKFDDEIGELCDSINEMSVEISRAERIKNEFISSISHELRTPLTAIIGWGETLTSVGFENPGEIKKGISIILKETRRLSKMVEELLNFARMESGRFNLHIEPMDLKAEFEEVLFVYNETFKIEGIEIHYEQNDDDIYMNGDRARLKQVFFNIIDNAVKHGKSGGRLDFTVDSDGAFARIVIRDYGEGIPEDELPYVKLKFYKGSSKATGSGIGLAVCDEIVKLHGGELKIESEYGNGTQVTILLPIMKETETEESSDTNSKAG